MAAWAKGIPYLLALLQEGEEDDKDEEEEADSGLGDDEDELEVDVGDNEEPVEVQNGQDGGSNQELSHLTLMYEVGSRTKEKVGHYETLDMDSGSTKNLDKNKEVMDEAAERLKREAEYRKDTEDIVNFVREQEQAKIQSWVTQTTVDKKEEEEIYKDYRSPFIFRWITCFFSKGHTLISQGVCWVQP